MILEIDNLFIVKSKVTGNLYEVLAIDTLKKKYLIRNQGHEEWWRKDRFEEIVKKESDIEELKKRIDALEDIVLSLSLKVLAI